MTGRRWRLLAILVVLAVSGIWIVWQLVQPERLGAWLVAQAAARSGLQISTRTPASLRLRDGLQLGMRGLDVRAPGASSSILQAEELALRLEWSVLWGETRVRGLDLWQPVLDQSALDAWMALAPAEPPEATDTAGFALTELRALRVREGVWNSGAQRVASIDIDLDGFAQQQTSTLDASAELPGVSPPLRAALRLECPDTDLRGGIAWQACSGVITMDEIDALELEGHVTLLPTSATSLAVKLRVLAWPEAVLGARPDWIEPLLQSNLHLAWPGPDPSTPVLLVSGEGAGHDLQARLQPAALRTWLAGDAWWQLPPVELQARLDRLDIEGIELHGITVTTTADERATAGEQDAD